MWFSAMAVPGKGWEQGAWCSLPHGGRPDKDREEIRMICDQTTESLKVSRAGAQAESVGRCTCVRLHLLEVS